MLQLVMKILLSLLTAGGLGVMVMLAGEAGVYILYTPTLEANIGYTTSTAIYGLNQSIRYI